MDGDIFYVVGILLVIAALVLSYFGIRGADSFPPSRAILVGVTGLFATIVVVTAAFAIDLSEEEQAHREAELAHEEEQAAQEAESAGEAQPTTPGGQPQAVGGGPATTTQPSTPSQTLDVDSPEDGGLVFEPAGLEATPGSLTITYANPSQVPHSLALATANGNVLGETSVFTAGEESVDVPELAPGKYVFYCTVPGHREAGMEGDLTVTGGPTP
jgi:plastocyanin